MLFNLCNCAAPLVSSGGPLCVGGHQGNLIARQRRAGQMFSEPREGMP